MLGTRGPSPLHTNIVQGARWPKGAKNLASEIRRTFITAVGDFRSLPSHTGHAHLHGSDVDVVDDRNVDVDVDVALSRQCRRRPFTSTSTTLVFLFILFKRLGETRDSTIQAFLL